MFDEAVTFKAGIESVFPIFFAEIPAGDSYEYEE